MQLKCQRGCLLWWLCLTAFCWRRHRWGLLPSEGRNSVLQLQRPQMQTRSQHGLPSHVAAASVVVAAVRVLPFLVRPVGPSAVGLSAVASAATSPMGVPMEGSARIVSGTGDVQVTFQLYRYLMPEAVVSVVGEVRYFQRPPSTHPGHGRSRIVHLRHNK